MSFTMNPTLVGLARARASAKHPASDRVVASPAFAFTFASRPHRRGSLVVRAGAKGGGGKKSAPPGTNPFASADLMALRGTLPSKPELAPSKPAGGDGEMVRMSEADVVAAFSDKRGGGSMKAARKAAKAGTGKDKTAASKPGAIGSGVGASRGLDPAAQAVLVGVTRSGKKGKTVTVVDGLDPGGPDAAKELVKKLKKVLGTGGSLAENGSMAFQGDNAAVLKDILVAMGYKKTRQTGGLGHR